MSSIIAGTPANRRSRAGRGSVPPRVAAVTVGVLGVGPGWQDDSPSHPVVEIAIYPDVAGLAARSLRARSPSYLTAGWMGFAGPS
jgi:hypothetical protein